MLLEQPHAAKSHRIPKWLWLTGAIFVSLIGTGAAVLAAHWPFTRTAMIHALEEASGRQVRIRTFSYSYLPPGCSAEGVRFLRHKHPDESPIITVDKLIIAGSLTGLFGSPKRLAAVRVVGMHMLVPPKTGEPDNGIVFLNAGPGGKSLVISKIVADGAVLEFVRQDRAKPHYILTIDKLRINDVGAGIPMSYHATVTNTEPTGVIRTEGKFGPWNPVDIGATPLSGEYNYDDIDLRIFKSIVGKGQAQGQFSGTLAQIRTHGSVNVAGFQVEGSDHAVQLATTFDATVNGTNGDVQLSPAVARYRHTQIEARGAIAGHEGADGKTGSFDVAVPKGRVDDLLYLFSRGEPGMSGEVVANGKFLWPPGPRKFLEKIRMDLAFGMTGSRFTSPDTQDTIDTISKSAQGENKKQEAADPRTMLSLVRGNIQLRDGVAAISNGRFQVPGADISVHGTYNFLNKQVDLHGTLDTRGHLSDTTSGFKALVIKIAMPLFSKQKSVRMIPFQITGSYGNTSVGIDWKRDLLR